MKIKENKLMDNNTNLTRKDYTTISLIRSILIKTAEKDETFKQSQNYEESIQFLEKVKDEISFFERVGAAITTA